jgi:hypothetical protein
MHATEQDSKQMIRDNINSFPREPSRYCRRISQEEYLSNESALTEMYYLYVNLCPKKHYAYEMTLATNV